jgi:hypothetical protein
MHFLPSEGWRVYAMDRNRGPAMSKAQEYRRFAQDCREVALRLSIKEDRERMLRAAELWQARAEEAERDEQAKGPGNI